MLLSSMNSDEQVLGGKTMYKKKINMKTIKRQHYLLFTHDSFELTVIKLKIYNLISTLYSELSVNDSKNSRQFSIS